MHDLNHRIHWIRHYDRHIRYIRIHQPARILLTDSPTIQQSSLPVARTLFTIHAITDLMPEQISPFIGWRRRNA